MKKKSNNKKYYYIGGAIIVLVAIILLLIVSCNKGYKIELMVDNKLFYQTTIHEGDTIEEVKEPTKEGYTFAGWYLNDEKFDVKTEIKEDMKLEAKFVKNEYKITLKYNNGKTSEIKIEYGEKVTKPKTPTRNGYIFEGWYVGEEEYDFNKKVTNNITIEAKWKKKANTTSTLTETTKEEVEYRVEHYLMGLDGEYKEAKEIDVIKAEVGTNVTPEVKEYEGFSAPKEKEVTILGDGSLVVKYYYERNKYTLTVKGDKGVSTITGNGEYYYEEEVNVEVELKPGYEFEKGSNKFTYTMEAKDATVEIKTKAIEYKITYKLNDGTYAKEMPTTYTVEDTIELGVPTKEGYTFDYYKVNGKKIEGTKIPSGTYTEDLKIEAFYKANEDTKYTVNHYIMDLDGEHYTLKETDKLSGTTDSKVTPEVKEYVGFSAPRKEELTITPNGKATLDYYYTRNKYTLTIEGDKGVSSTTGSGKYYYEEEVTNTGYTLKEGYEFDSYSVEIKNNTYKMGASDITIEVKTKPINYNISYDLDDSFVCEDCTLKSYTIEEEVILPEASKEGYTFIGWLVNDGKEAIKSFAKGTYHEDLLLTADFEANKDTPYKVVYHIMDTEGKYTITKEENYKGTTDTKIEYTANIADYVTDINGFDTPVLKENENGSELSLDNIVISGKGNTVLNYYVVRKQFVLNVKENKGIKFQVSPQKENNKYYYEEEISINTTVNNGYEFKKWSNNQTTKDITITMGAEDTILEATIELINYHITFDIKDVENVECSNCDQITYTVEDEKIILPEPTLPGYTFNGWVKNGTSELIKEVESGSYGDLTLTLSKDSFTVKEDTPYKVVYHIMDTNGKYTIENEENYKGTTDTKIVYTPNIADYVTDINGFDTPVLKENENGSELSLDNIVISGKGNTVLNYYVVRKQFDLTIEKGIGIASTTGEGKHYYEENVLVTAQLSEGYENITWNPLLNEDNTYTMKVSENKLQVSASPMSITYNVLHLKSNKENNTIDDSIDTIDKCINSDLCEVEKLIAPYDSKVTPADKNYDGFTASIPSNTIVKNNLIIIVKYIRNEYNLSINLDKGISKLIINNEEKKINDNKYIASYYFEQNINIKIELKNGYEFTKWSNDENSNEINVIMGTENIKLKATTKAIDYNINYNLEKGKCDECDLYKTYTVEGLKNLPTPTKKNYVFGGWLLDGKVITEIEAGRTGEITLTAKWYNEVNLEYVDSVISNYGNFSNYYDTEVKSSENLVIGYIKDTQNQSLSSGFSSGKWTAIINSIVNILTNDKNIKEIYVRYASNEEIKLDKNQMTLIKQIPMEIIGQLVGMENTTLGQFSLLNNKELNIRVVLNEEEARTVDNKTELNYILQLRTHISKEEFVNETINIPPLINNNSENHFLMETNGNTILLKYKENAQIYSTFLSMGFKTAFIELLNSSLIDYIELTFPSCDEPVILKSGTAEENKYTATDFAMRWQSWEFIRPFVEEHNITWDSKVMDWMPVSKLKEYNYEIKIKLGIKHGLYVEGVDYYTVKFEQR